MQQDANYLLTSRRALTMIWILLNPPKATQEAKVKAKVLRKAKAKMKAKTKAKAKTPTKQVTM